MDANLNDTEKRTLQMPLNRLPGSRPTARTLLLVGLTGLLPVAFSHSGFASQAPQAGAATATKSTAPPPPLPGHDAAGKVPVAGQVAEPGTELVPGPQPPDGHWLADES